MIKILLKYILNDILRYSSLNASSKEILILRRAIRNLIHREYIFLHFINFFDAVKNLRLRLMIKLIVLPLGTVSQ